MAARRSNLTVEEFTTPNPITADETAGVEDMRELMRGNDIRHLPIVRDDEIVGIVSQRDLAVVAGLELDKQHLVRASDIMSADPVTVRTSDALDDVAYRMSERKIGSVIVLDDSGAPFGIFTATDALNALIEIVRGAD